MWQTLQRYNECIINLTTAEGKSALMTNLQWGEAPSSIILALLIKSTFSSTEERDPGWQDPALHAPPALQASFSWHLHFFCRSPAILAGTAYCSNMALAQNPTSTDPPATPAPPVNYKPLFHAAKSIYWEYKMYCRQKSRMLEIFPPSIRLGGKRWGNDTNRHYRG